MATLRRLFPLFSKPISGSDESRVYAVVFEQPGVSVGRFMA